MRLVRMITWSGRTLTIRGFTVDASPVPTSRLVGHIRDLAPAAVLIDLDRKPSYGRVISLVLRTTKSTGSIPIVFAGGLPEKIERVKRDLPGALFTDWKNVAAALKKAIARGPASPLPKWSYMQQWAGSSLGKKLGLIGIVSVLNAPEGFEELLGEIPESVELKTALTRQTRLAVWFVRSREELESGIDFMSVRLPEKCQLWIVYPKTSGRHKADLTQTGVRAIALSVGMVDYKICAVDQDWSGMKFTRKRV
jgi:hypothetical protein